MHQPITCIYEQVTALNIAGALVPFADLFNHHPPAPPSTPQLGEPELFSL